MITCADQTGCIKRDDAQYPDGCRDNQTSAGASCTLFRSNISGSYTNVKNTRVIIEID